jgi:chitin disaccharide deacetylase
MSTRQLIVNADDFGQSRGINSGVIEAHNTGIVTSASLMVRWPHAQEAADYARYRNLSVGLHVDLGEWIFLDGQWTVLYEVVQAQDAAAVRNEVQRQLDRFRQLLDREPTHLDSHQHVHRHEPAHSIVRGLADDIGIPCRGYSPVRYCGNFYGQANTGEPLHGAISAESLMQLLTELPAGITELGCHPGLGSDLHTMYVHEREHEVRALCDRRVRNVIENEKIVLCSFSEIREV